MTDLDRLHQQAMAGAAREGLPPPLRHPDMGRVQGVYRKGAVQYLGVQYATLAHRFADAEVVCYDGRDGDTVTDATRHGPPVVTPPGAAAMEMSFVQQALPELDVPAMSDTEGLSLNITVPEDRATGSATGSGLLPVLVYVHGGGFAFGASSYPHYDQSRIVELSSVVGTPMVAVNLNYRLGIPGFLTSAEMRAAGIAANRGLADQRAALRWVRRYIGGFGGDAARITVVGQSAGAASVQLHLLGDAPLFDQAALVGGSFLMMPPATPDAADAAYARLSAALGLADLAPADRLAAWTAVPVDALVAAAVMPDLASLGPVVDGVTIPRAPSVAGLAASAPDADPSAATAALPMPGVRWCRRLLLVDSQLDGSIFGQVNVDARTARLGAAFAASVEHSLRDQPGAAGRVLAAYGLAADTADDVARDAVVQLITDVAFYAAAVRIAAAWPGAAALVHLNQPNPWPGPYHGRASHLFDMAMLWGNYNRHYGSACWAVGRAFSEAVVAFVAATDAAVLPVFRAADPRVAVFGARRRHANDTDDKDRDAAVPDDSPPRREAALDDPCTERNSAVFALADSIGGLDVLLGVVFAFLRGA